MILKKANGFPEIMHGLSFYLLKRVALALLTLFIILFVSYLLLRLAPGDPTKSSMLSSQGTGSLSSEKGELVKNDSLREKLHLDKPPYVGFYLWMKQILLHGDFGTSVSVDKGRPVTELILERLPITLRLNIMAIFLTYLLAIPMGILAGVFPDSRYDKITTFLLFFLYSLPTLWVALILQATLCKGGYLPLFPLKGLEPELTSGLSTWRIIGETLMHYVLPVLCLTYGGFAGLSRFTRSAMMDVIKQDYIRTAVAKGVPPFDVILSHAFRNTLVIMVTLFAGLLPALVSGSILVEYVFNIPGMGSLSMMALSSRDIPLLMTLFAFGGALTLAGMLLADILYVFVDPRISFQSRV